MYQAGTLRYTSAGVIVLFFWLLWGDFCLYLMEAVVPSVLPLQLKGLGANASFMTGLLAVTPGLFGIFWSPVISTWSDRFRSKWGRRIPFLIGGTPLIVLILMALGFSDSIGQSLHNVSGENFSAASITIGVISVLVIGFYACNVVIYNLYFSLFNDVVPRELMERFAVLFRVVGTSASVVFNLTIFPHAQTHLREIYIGAAFIYGIAYLMMCFKVREGNYPPPTISIDSSESKSGMIRTYFRECFCHRLYIYYFLSGAFWVSSLAMTPFLLLMNLSLGLTMEQVGWVNGSAALISIPAFLVTGVLMARVGALKLYFWMKVAQVFSLAGLMVFLFTNLPHEWVLGVTIALNMALLSVNAVLLVAGIPINMMILPRDRYAQFSSAGSMVSGIFGVIGGVLGGLFMDALISIYGDGGFAYRYAPVWATIFAGLSMLCFYKVYRFVVSTHGNDLATFVPPSTFPSAIIQ